jgi:cellulose synthase/poly-beta-1,6-N-acetylglucosamine synthase-like glycosyltransferase
MLNDWIHWLSSIARDQWLLWLWPLLLFDAPRYAFSSLVMCLWDIAGHTVAAVLGKPAEARFDYCPSVCVVMAGLNEADTLGATLNSVWGTYPKMEIIVVDDGSTDGMSEVAHAFAADHAGVTVLRKPCRGGKSSALNFALPLTKAEVIVCIDTDSHLGPNAIWEIVQPLSDPRVGAVSATVSARNPYTNLVTRLQAVEYRRCIFVGRMVTGRIGCLGIVSGAFGAFRRSAIDRVRGWDVGPGEDGDLVLRIRKAGFKIACAPYAECFTNLPASWWRLAKQRRRWDWSVITFECRKHVDLSNLFGPNFRLANLCLLAERWLFNIVLLYSFWVYFAWLCFHANEDLGKILWTYYVIYLGFELLQLVVTCFYSTDIRRDLLLGLAAPLMPLYYAFLRAVSVWAVTEEMLSRRSFRDNFVPEHVRRVTWHW